MPSYWGNCSPWSPPCGVDGPVPVVPGPANESEETPGCQTKSQLDEYFHLSPYPVIIKWWKFNLHSIKYGKNGAALLWVAIYVCFHVLCLCGLLLCRLGQVLPLPFGFGPTLPTWFSAVSWVCIKSRPEQLEHAPCQSASIIHPPPSASPPPPYANYVSFWICATFLPHTHTSTLAHFMAIQCLGQIEADGKCHVLWLRLHINSVCGVYVRGVCACVCFEGFRAAFAPGSTLEMLECLSGFSLSQHYANAALLPISICLFMNCY